MLRDNWVYRRGDLYIADLDPYQGSEQGGCRPVVVLQNDEGNKNSPTLIVAPLTTKDKKPEQPTHYYVHQAWGLNEPSVISLEQIRTIDKSRIRKYVGRLSNRQMEGVGLAVKRSLGLEEKKEHRDIRNER